MQVMFSSYLCGSVHMYASWLTPPKLLPLGVPALNNTGCP